MTNVTRPHLAGTLSKEPDYLPAHLTKQAFGNRLFRAMQDKGWNQSELARRAGLLRDSISTYVRGRALPSSGSLAKLADALDMQPHELLPNVAERAMDLDQPSLEIKVSTMNPGVAWVRLDRMLTLETAVRITELVQKDRAPQGHVAD